MTLTILYSVFDSERVLADAVSRPRVGSDENVKASGLHDAPGAPDENMCRGGCDNTSAYRGSTRPRGAVVSGLRATPRGAVVSARPQRSPATTGRRGERSVSTVSEGPSHAFTASSILHATVLHAFSLLLPSCMHSCRLLHCMHSASCYRPRQRSVSSYAGK